MVSRKPRLYFDFVDPVSYLVELDLGAREGGSDPLVERMGLELRPPPAPLTAVTDPFWAERWTIARRAGHERGVSFAPPELVPWTRKAHELHRLACTEQRGPEACLAIYEAFHVRGEDIGRIDVLVGIAVGLGMDRTATKATLDVDRFESEVVAARAEAREAGVADLPAFMAEDGTVRGFRKADDLSTLLPDA